MGRATYKTEDYANRILVYLYENPNSMTKDIMEEVTGTNYRLLEGFVWLIKEEKVRVKVTDHLARWSVEELMWTQ